MPLISGFFIPQAAQSGHGGGYYNQILNPICWVLYAIFYQYRVITPTWQQSHVCIPVASRHFFHPEKKACDAGLF